MLAVIVALRRRRAPTIVNTNVTKRIPPTLFIGAQSDRIVVRPASGENKLMTLLWQYQHATGEQVLCHDASSNGRALADMEWIHATN